MEARVNAPEFSDIIPRWGTWSAKWDLLAKPLGEDAISLSVADMEFLSCPAVRDALRKAVDHGIYGYTEVFADYSAAAASWQRHRHGWEIPPETIMFFPRIVQMIASLLNYCFEEPPVVATLTPAYNPILEVTHRAHCEVIEVPLEESEAGFTLPVDELTTAIAEADIFLLCSPHNPTGRVWTREELTLISQLALCHGTLVVSDDIHADFVREGASYLPLAKIAPELVDAGLIVTCLSPGKTFNTAGLEAAAIVVPNPDLREALGHAKRRMGLHNPNYFAIPATIAAWTQGHDWVDSLNRQIAANLATAEEALVKAGFGLHRPEGTYLLWVEASPHFNTRDDIEEWQRRARVAVSPGWDFGSQYERWVRINTAVPPTMLEEALNRLITAIPDNGVEP